MKKFKGVLLIICLLLLSGCIKNKTTMTINFDKSIDYTSDLLIKSEYAEELTEQFDDEDYKKNGFNITTINEDGYSGYRISKKFKNIDDLSNNNGQEVIISNIAEDNFDESLMFKREKGLLKDTYTANFKYGVDTSSLDNTTNSNDEYNQSLEEDDMLADSDSGETSEMDLSSLDSLMGSMEASFTINLPFKAVSHNATDVDNENKTLKWNLSSNEEVNINFSFSILNIKNILVIAGCALGVIVLLIIIISCIKKKKNNKKTLIHKEYDPSIAKDIGIENETNNNVSQNENANNTVEFAPQQMNNLEFSISEEEMQKHKEEEEKKRLEIEENLGIAKKQETKAPSIDYNVRPDFVRDTEQKTFVLDEHVEKPKEIKTVSSIELDVPDAIAFSDMDKKE